MVKRTAFSLLELLVVIVIISLLAVFGHAEYLSYYERSKISEALNELEQYQSVALELRARKGTIDPYYVLFSDSDQAGLLTGAPGGTSASKQVNLKYVNNIFAFTGTTGGGENYILLGAQLQDDGIIVSGADFVYIAGVESSTGVLTWQCGASVSQGNTINSNYLPQTCQSTLP